MTATTLTKTETTLLIDSAGREGRLLLPDAMKEVSRKRVLGKLLRDGLIAGSESGDSDAHRLTPAGYRAVGLRPPRVRRTAQAEGLPPAAPPAAKAPPKLEQVLALLARDDGASLAELIELTGWLPHTTRAALSRIRSSQPLGKGTRQDGKTFYRLAAPAPSPARSRKARVESPAAAVAG